MFYIYKITNKINNKIYIGQTNYPSLRWSQHKSNAKHNRSEQVITRALIKYGIENFIFEEISTCKTQEDVNYLEILLISQYDACNPLIGYNVDPGGNCLPRDPITYLKISNSLKEYYKTHTNWNKGGKLSKEWRANISKASFGKPGTNLGKKFSHDWVLKISKSSAGSSNKKIKRFSDEEEKEICRLYVEEQISTYKLGKIYNCSRSLILYMLNRYNIKTRDNNYKGHNNNCNIFSKDQEIEICDKYVTGNVTRAELARQYNCGKTTIRDVLTRNNIDIKLRQYINP